MLYLINTITNQALRIFGEEEIESEALLNLLQCITQLGQNLGRSEINSIDLEQSRIYSKSISYNNNNFLLIYRTSINSDKDLTMNHFQKIFDNEINPNINDFILALQGDLASSKKINHLSRKIKHDMLFKKKQINIKLILNSLSIFFGSFAIIQCIYSMLNLMSESTYRLYSNISNVIVGFSTFGILCCVVSIYRLKSISGIIWGLLSISYFLQTLGETSWTIIELGLKKDPFPSFADMFWMLGYVILFIALILEDNSIKIPRSKIWTSIWSIVLIGLIIAICFLFVIDLLRDIEYTLIEKFASLFYVIWDLILIFILGLIFFKYREGRLGISWLIMLIAISITSTADILYSYLDYVGLYDLYNYFNDPIFIVGYLLINVAGLQHWKSLVEE